MVKNIDRLCFVFSLTVFLLVNGLLLAANQRKPINQSRLITARSLMLCDDCYPVGSQVIGDLQKIIRQRDRRIHDLEHDLTQRFVLGAVVGTVLALYFTGDAKS